MIKYATALRLQPLICFILLSSLFFRVKSIYDHIKTSEISNIYGTYLTITLNNKIH